MAPDIHIEDPIGVGPTNPDGKGFRGLEAVTQFWDRTIATSSIRIETHESFAAGLESAHVLTLTTSFPNGVKIGVHGIFTYRVNEAGKLVHLRGYWTDGRREGREVRLSAGAGRARRVSPGTRSGRRRPRPASPRARADARRGSR